MTQSPTGGPAQTTYQVTSRAGVVGHDAQRVVIVTDGRAAEGGPQQAVYFVSDAEIAAGDFIVTGNKPLPIVQVGAVGVEYPPIAVYDVTGKPDDVQPSQNPVVPPVAPQFSTAEVGAVNASTLDVTFGQGVSASDYSAGVTIKGNGTATSIISATRQANHAIVRYVIPILWHGSADVMTWEYNSATGNIVAESDSTPLGNVTAQSVTNNCEYAALLDLQADTLALNDGDPISPWVDQSGNGHDFTQMGSARPAKQTDSGYPIVNFVEGATTYFLGQNWLDMDNLDSFMVMDIHQFVFSQGKFFSPQLTKFDSENGIGWDVEIDYYISVWSDYSNNVYAIQGAAGSPYDYSARHVVSHIKNSISDLKLFVDGVQVGQMTTQGVPTTFSTSQIVMIGSNFPDPNNVAWNMSAILFFSPIPNATNRAALEARLAARYGITL